MRAEGRAALIPYLTAGYPTRDLSLAALEMFAATGADFIEVGIPFSDPLADGPIIQRSTQVALERGMTVGGVLELVRQAALDVPVIAFGYLNPILAYGLPRFLEDACRCGISGLLVTDLPAGEDEEMEQTIRESPLDLIRLIAPTTVGTRIESAVAGAEGFVYLISRLGVTGPETRIGEGLAEMVARIRAATTIPVAIGFGIATGRQAAEIAGFGDGVVVGSALVKRLGEGIESARGLMHELATALRAVGTAPEA